jgi:POT family proton-dependent oligopeptide transporter
VTSTPAPAATGHRDTAGWGGHPRGLSTLFFTEMWERFAYYGMRALLILYMTAAVTRGGLGFDTPHAAAIYGWYTFSVYALAIPGGWIADRFLGQYRSVLVGGIIIALGQFSLALAPLPFFYSGLILIAIGTGLLKPNVSTMVGSLYEEEDIRRDAGFSIFYMGINVGAMISPLVAGTLGQRVSWHLGFAVGGVGMTIGLIQYTLGKRRLMPALERLEARQPDPAKARVGGAGGFTAEEWKRIAAIGVFFVFSMLFWAAFEQAGSSLNLFADRYTRLSVFGFSFPSTWFQSLNSFFMVFGLAIFFSWLWVRLGRHEPSSAGKFAYGLLFVGLGFLLLVPASIIAQSGGRTVLVSPMWLTGVYLLHTIGELCLSPVGLSLMTKLAPRRIVGLMMGVWFLSTATGNKVGGWVAGFFDTLPLPLLFAAVAGTTIGSAVVLVLLIRPVRKLMGGVH